MSFIIDVLKENGRLENLHFVICLVGSRKLPVSQQEESVWRKLAPNVSILGFDADEDACEKDNAELQQENITWQEKYIPLALSNKSQEIPLYVTNHVHCSSLYEPNEAYLSRLWGMDQGIKLDFTIEIETSTLDQFCASEGIEEIDYLQVDVQGADLDVIKGANELLKKSILGIQTEVEFLPLYLDQPLFSDIDVYLRNNGFTFFDLITDDLWNRRPRNCSPIFSNRRTGQLTCADARYFRDPISSHAHSVFKNPDKILKLACIVALLDYPDYAIELLLYLTVNSEKFNNQQSTINNNFAKDILQIFSLFPELIDQGLENFPAVQQITPFL